MKSKKKILILVPFSAGICGVWQRAKIEAIEFKKRGHDVKIFSSNATKGSKEKANKKELYQGIEIKRFPYIKLGGESYFNWNFEKDATQFNPDIIIAHNYRQIHTEKALKIAKKIKAKCYLVTHAPFIKNRPLIPRIVVAIKDLINPLNKFDKVITISKWEIPTLLRLGCKRENIAHIPNAIPSRFFSQKKEKEQKKILYLGRIHSRKDIEILMKSFNNSNLRNTYELEIVGPREGKYYETLINLKNRLKLKANFSGPIFDLKKKIEKYDSAEIFVLPSKFEPFGIVFLEAMARSKVIVATNTQGANELIERNKSGIIFQIGNEEQLRNIFNNLSTDNSSKFKKILKNGAKERAKQFEISKIVDKWENLFF
ncbi:glycosyltransferase family 4 protein [archaeon]|jgi:glycosyltransferase involved in cell wall biosynthesis|nr:glycosyltransferase family 4 protein [archaeon]MBT6824222.1 glycosyltransferase family 4 protein [archaeon]MBT7106760.1 glycosyltransferase family 4 protein [archaeon]MBT7297546.1 glycosyltransferase family 4 protein [archaeon]